MADMSGTYIHLDDMEQILAKAGLSLNLASQIETRRSIFVEGTPTGTAEVTIDEGAPGGPKLQIG